MDIKIEHIPTDDLLLGMYVSKLDRPWLETPFLFQGFVIESNEDIHKLQHHCEYVYIDVDRSDPVVKTKRRLADATHRRRTIGGRKKWIRNLAGKISRFFGLRKLTLTPAERSHGAAFDSVPLRKEMVNAKKAHTDAFVIVEDVLNEVRVTQKIDLTAIHQAVDPMVDSIVRNQDAMTWLTRMKKKDDYIFNHSIASTVWAIMFGRHLGLGKDDLQTLGMGAMLLDVGKTRISTEMLITPNSLTDEQMELMRQHVEHGVEIVRNIRGIDERVVAMVRTHHERFNGTGYPKGLEGHNIPIFGRIGGLVDCYDAMISDKTYVPAKSTYDAMRELNSLADVEFQAEMVEQFIQAIGMFPVGTLVELSTGEVAVIIAQNRVRRLRPKVLVILDKDKQRLEEFPVIDLRKVRVDEKGEQSLWITKGLEPGAHGIDPMDYYL